MDRRAGRRASPRPAAEPWLPFGELAGVNVAAQRSDPGSPLNLTRDLIALRRAEEDLRAGAYAQVALDGGLWAYRRGEGFLVALNLGAEPASMAAEGRIAIGTHRQRDGEAITRLAAARARRGRRPAPGAGITLGPQRQAQRQRQHEHAAGDRRPRPRARRQAVAHERAAAGERALPGQRGAEGADDERGLARRGGVRDGRQADA